MLGMVEATAECFGAVATNDGLGRMFRDVGEDAIALRGAAFIGDEVDRGSADPRRRKLRQKFSSPARRRTPLLDHARHFGD